MCICVAVEGGQMHEDAGLNLGSACATERLETKKAGDLSRAIVLKAVQKARGDRQALLYKNYSTRSGAVCETHTA